MCSIYMNKKNVGYDISIKSGQKEQVHDVIVEQCNRDAIYQRMNELN